MSMHYKGIVRRHPMVYTMHRIGTLLVLKDNYKLWCGAELLSLRLLAQLCAEDWRRQRFCELSIGQYAGPRAQTIQTPARAVIPHPPSRRVLPLAIHNHWNAVPSRYRTAGGQRAT